MTRMEGTGGRRGSRAPCTRTTAAGPCAQEAPSRLALGGTARRRTGNALSPDAFRGNASGAFSMQFVFHLLYRRMCSAPCAVSAACALSRAALRQAATGHAFALQGAPLLEVPIRQPDPLQRGRHARAQQPGPAQQVRHTRPAPAEPPARLRAARRVSRADDSDKVDDSDGAEGDDFRADDSDGAKQMTRIEPNR
jgi:hypothetical protein